MITEKNLIYYQKDLIKKVESNNIIIVDWMVGQGIDHTLDFYLKNNPHLKSCYIGYSIISKTYYSKIDFRNHYKSYLDGINYDIIILDDVWRKPFILEKFINDLYGKYNTLIIKTNLSDCDFDIGDYIISDGTITKEIDRKQKMERLIK